MYPQGRLSLLKRVNIIHLYYWHIVLPWCLKQRLKICIAYQKIRLWRIKKMKNINIRYLISAGICFLLSIVCMILLLNNGFQLREFISIVLLLLLCCVNLYQGISKKAIREHAEILNSVDERDILIVMKSAKTTMQIVNMVMFISFILFILLYGITKVTSYMTIACTILTIQLSLFVVSLGTQMYYEKKE